MLSKNFSRDAQDKELENWLQEKLGREIFSPEEGRLDRYFSEFKSEFKKQKLPLFIIAGTNGKGEVALGLESVLLQAGHCPFLWSSPHVLSVRERFSCAGYPISGEELSALFKKHQDLCTHLSFYEFLFFCFCDWVKEKAPKHNKPCIIFEVGLGGRLDATNFFDCDYSALVSIGRDHVEILGPTLSHILKEKIAVTRPGKTLVSAVSQDFLVHEVASFCHDNNVKLTQVYTGAFEHFKEVNRQVVKELFHSYCDEMGEPVPKFEIPEKLWARPFEVTYKSSQFILVGSHNLDGLRHLATWVNEQRQERVCSSDYDEVWVGMSRLPGPELDQCLKLIALSPCLGSEVVLFDYEHPRATSLNDMKLSWEKIDQGRKVRFEKSWQHVLQTEQGSKKILVCGSYYFVGELLRNGPFQQFQ